MTDIKGEADFRNVQNGRVPAPAGGGSGLRTHTHTKSKEKKDDNRGLKKTTVVCRKETVHEFYKIAFFVSFSAMRGRGEIKDQKK